MIPELLEYRNMNKHYNASLIYDGPMCADGIEGIAGALKKRLERDRLPMSESQSVFSVFVEQANNMLMYSEEKERIDTPDGQIADVPKGLLILGSRGKKYFIQSGNVIKSEKIGLIKERIDLLNTMDKAELRKYYKERLKGGDSNPDSKGAGLGLIEIARRASSKIEYDFKQLTDEQSFFTIYVTVG